MKKILSIVLCAIMLLGVFATTASATTESAIPTDIRKFGAYGQGHIFLGEAISTNKPLQDGVIGTDEYAAVYEVAKDHLMPYSDCRMLSYVEYLEGNDISLTMYYSYDTDGYLYAAAKLITPDYCVRMEGNSTAPTWNYGTNFLLSLSARQSGDFWAAVSRSRFVLQGRDRGEGPIEGGYLSDSYGCSSLLFDKEGAMTRPSGCSGSLFFHSVALDETTDLYTAIYEYRVDLNALFELQGVEGEIGDEIMSIMTASDVEICSRTDPSVVSDRMGYYTQGILMESEWIDVVSAAYEDSPYTPEAPWLPDVLHFCAEPTDEAEYIALTGGRPAADAPEGGDEGNTPVDPDAGADLEEEDDEKEDTKKEDTKKEDTTTKAPETTTAAADEAKKGCKGMIGGGAIALVATVGCGVSVISRKKRK